MRTSESTFFNPTKMEGLSMNAYRGIQGYWKKKRGYQRLNGPSSKARRDLARLGPPSSSSDGGARPRRRLWRWRIKITPKIARVGSPKKWLVKLRDAYVKMMLSFATSAGFNGGYGPSVEYGGFGKPALKEYDEKVLVEIYKSVLRSQGQMVSRDAPNLPTSQSQLNNPVR